MASSDATLASCAACSDRPEFTGTGSSSPPVPPGLSRSQVHRGELGELGVIFHNHLQTRDLAKYGYSGPGEKGDFGEPMGNLPGLRGTWRGSGELGVGGREDESRIIPEIDLLQ
jgi:hypothetical protein